LIALAGPLALAAPAGAGTSPIQPGNRPTPLDNRENGRLPASDLVTLNPDCRAVRAAAPSLRLLLETAHQEGVGIGTTECYRPVDDQVVAQQNASAAGNSACAAKPSATPGGKVQGTSMHGWGKAVDFSDPTGSMNFGSPGYRWLKANAARFGWNHPGWAEPGGSACPEAWHWEWVGDGGTMGADSIKVDVVTVMCAPSSAGWWTATGLGAVVPGGGAAGHGGADREPLQQLVVGGAAMPDGTGYWLAASDGGIFSYGGAPFWGSAGGTRLNKPVVGMASTPSGLGYWLVASDGGVFTYGDAGFYGSMGGQRLNRQVVGIASSPSGFGYWLVASDGGIFSFGDARFLGSTGGMQLNRPVVGMAGAASGSGNGYWLVASDGGIFSFGDAPFRGSLGGRPTAPVVGLAATGGGYRLAAADGTVTSFGV
jgi:hypothetical protein